MKKILFIVLSVLAVSAVCHASFPISETSQTVSNQVEYFDAIHAPLSPISSNGPGWGIAAIACGFVGLFVAPFILGPLAIIFGALGLKKNLKGLAIAGLVLGIVELLIIGLLIGVLLALA